MKLKEIFTQTKNINNKQISFNLRKKKLESLGITIKDIMEMEFKKNKGGIK